MKIITQNRIKKPQTTEHSMCLCSFKKPSISHFQLSKVGCFLSAFWMVLNIDSIRAMDWENNPKICATIPNKIHMTQKKTHRIKPKLHNWSMIKCIKLLSNWESFRLCWSLHVMLFKSTVQDPHFFKNLLK